MIYDSAGNIINTAATECGLSTAVDPFASTTEEMVQLRTLLTSCGRELWKMHPWQRLVKTHTFNTGASPPPSGEYTLPADFGYMANQTFWSPQTGGTGFPITGPATPQIWSTLKASNTASPGPYGITFTIRGGRIVLMPAPAPASVELRFDYYSNHWVLVNGVPTTTATLVANTGDVVLFDVTLITKMLIWRFKQAKGLDAASAYSQFVSQLAFTTGLDQPAMKLPLVPLPAYPYLDPNRNLPDTHYGT